MGLKHAFASTLFSLAAAGMPAHTAEKDTAVCFGQFKTVVAAFDPAGLVATLKSGGRFTVFVPTE